MTSDEDEVEGAEGTAAKGVVDGGAEGVDGVDGANGIDGVDVGADGPVLSQPMVDPGLETTVT
eukprot:CAMPEP_0116572526 /NCGR_PEP_ID=MMETSP0397-20121206/18227_1 /TAXON_ID=216820 /ORGANISM="Cyclophora tenuis, Strain ECT3854" /LENGTH=62 /DNA_ID=CAMNT_0004100869 /DNA_START=255 /DNA_END=440 /DNA_ORIENTATION=+